MFDAYDQSDYSLSSAGLQSLMKYFYKLKETEMQSPSENHLHFQFLETFKCSENGVIIIYV